MTAAALERFSELRLAYFSWSRRAGMTGYIPASLAFAALTGLMARVSFMLPWTPVPVTGQTFAVLLAGALLGRRGSLSQFMYIGLGAAGIPWFAHSPIPLPGPTMGYLAGFIVAPYVIGRVTESYPQVRRFSGLLLLLCLVNFIVIHGIGAAWLYIWLGTVQGQNPTLFSVLSMGSVPFIPGDILKVLLAAVSAYLILPKSR